MCVHDQALYKSTSTFIFTLEAYRFTEHSVLATLTINNYHLLLSDDGVAARHRIPVWSEVLGDQHRTVLRGSQAASCQGRRSAADNNHNNNPLYYG